MITSTSDAFNEAVKAGHQHCAKLQFVEADGTVVDDTWDLNEYFVMDNSAAGKIQYAREQDSRTTASGELIVVNNNGVDIADPLSGVEIVPYMGVLIDGQPEWVRMGTLGITRCRLTREMNRLKIQWTAVDRSDAVRWKPWSGPFYQPKNLDYSVAIRNILEDRPVRFKKEYNLERTDGSIKGSVKVTAEVNYDENEDPWGTIMSLAVGAGQEAYFGDYGELCSTFIRDDDPAFPVATYVFGQDSMPFLTTVTKETENREVYSGVIVYGEAPWLLFPIRGEAWDDNPLSRSGRPAIGEKALKIGDAHVTTDFQCLEAARAQLAKVGGIQESVTFSMITDPRYRVGDVFQWYDPEMRMEGFMSLNTLSLDMGSGVMAGTIKRRVS